MTPIFLPLIGQYQNIGDIILRRPLAKWLQGDSRLHVFTGDAPAGYTEALQLRPDDHVYTSFLSWYRAGMETSRRQKSIYLFKPGEIQLSLKGMKEHLGVLPMAKRFKARGGSVARLGSGVRNFSSFYRRLITPSLKVSDLTYWRDQGSFQYLGHGGVMPDLAFAEGGELSRISSMENRRYLIVSMRGDRPAPNDAWRKAVRDFAEKHRLEIMAVTQVLMDSARSRELAGSLGGQVLDWDGHDHMQQEQRLRDVYRRAALVVSDRLHVLIAAYTEGAAPAGLTTDNSSKVDRHFEAIGLKGVGQSAATWSPERIGQFLEDTLRQRESYLNTLGQARASLDGVRKELVSFVEAVRGREA
ncbi:polysaccharide pyruvyl transferase family protein [Hahella aquimaris]|uniref:polysaccharide pyruvyl transferase family protein n=1 Tax=Hahella sp. HNIBRBA332 TaxID=3015983 RepID=UPI00273BCCBB|nr:polysaccharide pyruvyl transferase family protein [Hahella sp. HNIBRBA332]WLQ16367.1 polysaccharide pyruvyl transferase family protein [Hahella sp. HNIBRBA332]